MRGGFLDTLSTWGSSLSQSATNLWDKTKTATSSATSSLTGSTPTPTTPTYPPTTSDNSTMATSTYGGKSRKRRMRGGFSDNTPTTGLAAHAASFSGQTAKPHNIVGGKTKRRHGGKHRHSKSCKTRKH
jgi:hypothetical protein